MVGLAVRYRCDVIVVTGKVHGREKCEEGSGHHLLRQEVINL